MENPALKLFLALFLPSMFLRQLKAVERLTVRFNMEGVRFGFLFVGKHIF